jgi:predicted DNA-binding transcriptional regulator AlpA
MDGQVVGLVGTRVTEPLLTARDVAKLLSVPMKRVYELGIPAVRLSTRSLRWRLSDVQQWIERRIKR